MRSPAKFLHGIPGPPTTRQPPQFEPPRRQDPESFANRQQARARKLVVRRDKGLRFRKARVQQAFPPTIQSPRNFGRRRAIELQIVMMTTVLDDVIRAVLFKELN